MKHALTLIILLCVMGLGIAWGQPLVEEPTFLTVPVTQTLYYRCANEMNLFGLAPGALDKIVEGEVKGGDFKLDASSPGKAIVVPKVKKFQLTSLPTKNGDSLPIVPLEYQVVKPPRPTLEIWVNGKKSNLNAPIPKDAEISIRAIPDTEFARKYPQDARYLIPSVRIIGGYSCMNRNFGRISRKEADPFNQLTFKMPTSVRNSAPGSKYYLELDGVYRVNFEDKRVEEKISQRDLMFGLVVR